MRRIAGWWLLFLLPLMLVSCGALWQQPADPIEQARTGQYAEAAAALEPQVEAGNAPGRAVDALAQSWRRTGQYAKGTTKFEAWAARSPRAPEIRIAAARFQRLSGNYAAALAHLDAVLSLPGLQPAAMVEKAQILELTGKRADADVLYKRITQAFQDGIIRNPADLIHVAAALRATEYFHDANETFKTATQLDPRNADAFAAWGDLLAEKYNAPEAVASYQDALKIDPNMPEANLGIAAVLALESPDRAAKSLEKALQVNPNLLEAHLLTAEQSIDAEQYDKASAELDKALQINPKSLDALSLRAAILYLRGKIDDFTKALAVVRELNPEYSKVFTTVADRCVSLRLYKQAVTFAREAIEVNPRDWEAYSILGINLMRIGEEKAGKESLEKAYEGDSFNVATVNTLTLLDSFDKFDRIRTPHFEIKLHNKESAVLTPVFRDLAERAYSELSRKYQFTPEGPLSIEVFPDHADFAVRALGLPGLGALGVCFGKLVAMDSPSARKPDSFNWGSTLWHEFMHVITLQITDHKIPRWFSEGLSVYEERKAFPGWGDDLKIDYLSAIQDKKLLSVAELNGGFTRPRYPEQVLVSYYQGSLICDYIEQKYGFDAIRRMLGFYKDGKDTATVFKEALGIDLDRFDGDFLDWVNERTSKINLKLFQETMKLGMEFSEKGDTDRAIDSFSKAIAMYPEYTDEHNPYEPLAEAYLQKGDKKAAIETLQKLLKYAETSFDSHLKLASLLEEEKDAAGALRALEGAVYIRPLDIATHQRLGQALLEQKQFARAATHFESLIALNAPDKAGNFYRLAEARLGEGNRAEARKNILKCLEIAPNYEAAQDLLLKLVR